MAGIVNRLSTRLALIVGGAQLVLLPFLYFQITQMVYESATEQFVNNLRSYSRFLADSLDSEIAGVDDPAAIELLDRIALSQDVVYAELTDEMISHVCDLVNQYQLQPVAQ